MDTKSLMAGSATHLINVYNRYPLCLVRGEGARVWDSDGREYLDFTSGIAVLALGHCHPKIVGAMREQAATLVHASNYFHIPQQIELAKLLCDRSFAARVFFSNSGAEANEAAIKLARKYAREAGASDRFEIITMRGGFHGRTLATVTATAQEKYHHGFEPMVPGFKYVPYDDLRAVERALDSHTAAVLVEPILGEGGVVVPDDGYLPGLRKLCDEAGVLLILDEVQTGMGRTGRLWAYEHAGITPDIMTVAKALANGIPIGATLATEAVASALTPGTHGSTFGGNPFATTVGLATLITLLEEKLPERAADMGRLLLGRLEALKASCPVITQVRGRGLLTGIELSGPAGPVVAGCRERGLLILTAGDSVVRLLPPLIVDKATVERALVILAQALAEPAR
ncbi:MAG: aspartate aminotransferase family protein [Candidatus Methylomirabilia bacterium]